MTKKQLISFLKEQINEIENIVAYMEKDRNEKENNGYNVTASSFSIVFENGKKEAYQTILNKLMNV